MTPYFQDEAVTIYHGDCREILVSLPKVDLVLTDPPYGIGTNFARNCTRRTSLTWGRAGQPDAKDQRPILIVGDQKNFDPQPLLLFPNVVLWGAQNFADKLPVSRGWLIWDKREGKASDNHGDVEMAWTTLDQPTRVHRQLWRGVVRSGEENTTNGPKYHPTQKPIRLMRWCLGFFPAAQIVLDPFMGSGTTLRAAKDLGRKAIGIEIEEKYCEIAAKRMAQQVLEFS